MIQVSGIRFRYDAARTKGARVIEITNNAGMAWNRSSQYTVATNSMLAAGGQHYKTFKLATNHIDHDSQYAVIEKLLLSCRVVGAVHVERFSVSAVTLVVHHVDRQQTDDSCEPSVC